MYVIIKSVLFLLTGREQFFAAICGQGAPHCGEGTTHFQSLCQTDIENISCDRMEEQQ
jgi:hypothetical protein